jgi:hypothetical protein
MGHGCQGINTSDLEKCIKMLLGYNSLFIGFRWNVFIYIFIYLFYFFFIQRHISAPVH